MNSLNKNVAGDQNAPGRPVLQSNGGAQSIGVKIGTSNNQTLKPKQKINPINDSSNKSRFEKLSKMKVEKSDNLAMNIIDRIVKISIYLTIFALPLFFAPNVPSVLELNKQVLLVVIVGIGFLAWVGKMAWKNEIRLKKDFIMVPVITFFTIFGLSTIMSIYREQSLWGFFGGEGKSFISLLFFVAFFFLVLNTIRTRKEALRVVTVFLVSGTITTLYGVLQIWEIYALPFEFTQNPFFNTVGSVYILAVYVGALFLLSLALFLSDVSKVMKIVLVLLAFFFFFVLMVINFKIVWFALILCMAFLFGVTIIKGGNSQGQARILPMVFLVLTLLMILRPKPLMKKNLPVEILLNHKTSISLVMESFKENPMLGSGPTTFTSVYQKNRPDDLGDYWSINFNSASSYFLTLLSTTGILGGLAFLFLVGTGVVYLFKGVTRMIGGKKEKEGDDYIAVGIGMVWLFVTLVLFTYLTNITMLFLWWFSLALFLAFSSFSSKEEEKEFVTTSATPKSSLVLSFVFVLVIIGFVASIYLQSQKYFAAVHFNKALAYDAKGEKLEDVSSEISKAVEMDMNRDVYYRNFSTALFAQANKTVSESKGEELSADESAKISGYIRGAIESANRAKALNEFNVDNYLALARVYEGVLVTMEGADEKAVEAYQEALKLDPKNPALYQKIASIYVSLSDVEVVRARAEGKLKAGELPETSKKNLAMARENLNKALEVKPDYAASNLLSVGVYEREGNIEGAIEKEKENRGRYQTAPGVAFRLGLLYYKQEKLDEAKKEFEGAIALDKDYANARYFLGLILDKQDKKKESLVQFRKIREKNQDNKDLNKIINNLESGKDALEGLGDADENVDVGTEEGIGGDQQPSINPDVENQEIPENATPSPDEIQPEERNSEYNDLKE